MSNWLVVSVFYDHSEWHKLFNACLKQLLYAETTRPVIFFIFLSEVKGDHLTICLNFPLEEHYKKDIFLTQLKSFLFENASRDNIVNRDINVLFERFPNNTLLIHQGSLLDLNNEKSYSIVVLRELISKIILSTLMQEQITYSDIMSLALHLQLGILRAKYVNLQNARNEITVLKSRVEAEWLAINDSEKFYQKNKNFIFSIVNDLWSEKVPTEDISDLFDWIDASREFMAPLSFSVAFYELNNLVIEHLGLKKKFFLYFSLQMICKILSEYRVDYL